MAYRTATAPLRLETPRLLLRPYEAGDVDDNYAYASDAEFARYFPSMPQPYTRADSEQFVAQAMATDWSEHPQWAIVLDGHVMGSISARFDTFVPRAEMAYGIAREHWNRGLTTEAARSVVDWLFSATDVWRVMASADERNIGSWRVMEHLGMQHEGTLRMHRNDRGTPANQVVYGLLRSEWESARR